MDQNAPCGHCAECRNGFPNACLTVHIAPIPGFAETPGIFHDGALAKYIVIPDYMLYPVLGSVPWHHLAITETVACAVNAVRKANPRLGETAVVLGGGPVGLLIVSMLRQSGTRVISSEPAAQRRNMAEKMGAAVSVDPKAQDLLEVVKNQTNGASGEGTQDRLQMKPSEDPNSDAAPNEQEAASNQTPRLISPQSQTTARPIRPVNGYYPISLSRAGGQSTQPAGSVRSRPPIDVSGWHTPVQ